MTHNQDLKELKKIKPFVKWVGGKRQLIKQIKSNMPPSFKNYYEPFLGGGAVLLELINNYSYNLHGRAFDINNDLVNAYQVIKHNVEELILKLKEFKYDKEFFYKLREMDRQDDFTNICKITKAARFIYLNRTCFNGLYRVNKKGQFNVPFGKYKNPKICDEFNLRNLSQALKYFNIEKRDFADILQYAEKGDFIYMDPPYDVLSNTANFTSYNKSSFGRDEQSRLADTYAKLNDKGCFVMLSNHNTPFIQELYNKYNIKIVKANRSINSNAKKRGKVEEVLILNY